MERSLIFLLGLYPSKKYKRVLPGGPSYENRCCAIINNEPSSVTNSTLPIMRSNHPRDANISALHIQHIQTILKCDDTDPTAPIRDLEFRPIPLVSHNSFKNLLSYNSPTDDSILTSFLIILCETNLTIHSVDTNFSRFCS